MAVFPLFIDLKGRKCVVVGGGKVATRKIDTLIEFNAEIVVVSPKITKRIGDLERCGELTHKKKTYSEADMEDAFLVIAATSDKLINDMIYDDAVKRQILINVADNPEKCTFIFPAIVKKDDLVIGISSSGTYPMLSKTIKEKLVEMIPENLNEETIEILGDFRKKALAEIKDGKKQKEFLKRVLDEIMFVDEIREFESIRLKINKIFGEYVYEKNN